MKVVLDVSAAFTVITGDTASNHFIPYLESAEQVLAPDLFYSESTNTAWKFHHIKNVRVENARKLVEHSIQLVDIFFPSESFWTEALELACQLVHPAYDCFYLALAKQQEATLLTTDKRLIKTAVQLGISVVDPDGAVT